MDRQGYKPTHVCLHGTAGGTSAEAIANFFRDTADASAHIIIGTDGEVVQGISMDVAAWSNGLIDQPTMPWPANINPNYYTISIEHCKASTNNSDQLTEPQKQASFQVIQAICDYYGIAKRRGDLQSGIVSHADFDQVNRARCPGPYPWDELIAYLGGSQSAGGDTVLDISQASQYFIDTGTTKDTRWHCKSTGFDIAFGILTYYRTCTATGLNGLSQFGLPTSGEQKMPGYKAVTQQHFERGIIAYDPQKEMDSVPGISGPCYPAHIDKQSSTTTPTTPIVTINTQAAITTLQGLLPALQSAGTAIQTVIKDLEPS